LIATILTVGAANIQRFQSMDSFGGNPSEFLSQYQTHLAVMAVVILGLSSFLISRMVQAQTMSENEIGETLEKAVSGDFSNRAKITSSTELAQAAIDLNQLLDRMETAQSSANEKIQERTNELEQKNRKLLVAALVAREASSEQNIDSLLNRIVDLISERFGFYHAAVFLVDDIGENVILRAASSEGGKRMLEKGHQLKIGQQGIVGAAAYQNKAQIVFDVLSEINYYKNPELPMTRSEAAFPLFARGKVIGILDIQSNEQLALVQSDMEIIQILADQLGMVIQNTQLLSESQEAIKKLESMSQRDLRLAWQERLHGRKQSYRYTSKGFTIKSQGGSNETARDLSNKQISAPIKLRGQLLGNISLLRKTGSSWGEADRAMVSKIALQVGLALENVRLLNEAQRHASQEQALSDLTSRISQFLDPDIIMQNAIRELHHLPNVEEVSLFISPAITESNTTGNGA
jgi:GAF domain-containing protein